MCPLEIPSGRRRSTRPWTPALLEGTSIQSGLNSQNLELFDNEFPQNSFKKLLLVDPHPQIRLSSPFRTALFLYKITGLEETLTTQIVPDSKVEPGIDYSEEKLFINKVRVSVSTGGQVELCWVAASGALQKREQERSSDEIGPHRIIRNKRYEKMTHNRTGDIRPRSLGLLNKQQEIHFCAGSHF